MRAFLLALCALLLPTAAFAQADPGAPTGKLPDMVTPIAYRLDMTIVPEQPRFSGHTEIDIALKQAASSVYMHGRGLHIAKAVARIGGQDVPVTFTQVSPLGLARLDFGRTVAPGKMTLRFDYDGAYGGGPSGLYHLNIAGKWYAWTQFESIDARAAYPSFDEPGYKTPFTVSITTKPGFAVASNAPEVSSRKAGALVRHQFAPTKPLPTYLVAMVAGPFAVAETKVPPSPQRPYPLPLRVIATQPNAGKMKFALDESGKIVALLEKYFGQPFPFPKLDQIASPVMPGAMENAGADIYGDGILMLDADATPAAKGTFGMVVAHELSHQWFGDLVTPAWWDDIWLNESFANWMGYRIGNEWRPDLNIGVSAIDDAFEAMNLDQLKAGRPIHQHITHDAEIDSAFDQITYGKGGLVVGMIAAYLGDETFREGVRLHMHRHPYANASTDDFFGALADAAKDPRVLASLRSFVDQQGVPVVTLHRQGDGWTASQARYAFFGSDVPAEHWVIPLCVRRAATRSCTLLDRQGETVRANGSGALVPNAGGWGYYRFDLDPADWDALIAAGPTLSAGEALAMDDSLWAAFYAGKGSLPRLVQAARTMTAAKDSNAAVDNGERLAGLESRGLIAPEAMPAYRRLLGSIYGPMLADLGFDPRAGVYAKDDPDRQTLRGAVVRLMAHNARDTAVRAALVKGADAYLAGDRAALDPQFVAVALAVDVEEKGVPLARTLADRALGGTDGGFRRNAFAAISGSRNAEVANWFFSEFKDPRARPYETMSTALGFLGQPQTREFAADYLLSHFDQMSGGGGIFAGRAAGAFGGLCTLARADAIEAKLGPVLRVQGGALALDRAVEQIRNCARFRTAKAAEVSAAVQQLR